MFFLVINKCFPIEEECIFPDGKVVKVVYDIAQSQDAEEVFEFMLQHFFPVEPLRQIHYFNPDEETKRPKWKLDHIRQCFSKPYSLIVRELGPSGRLVAFQANYMEDRNTYAKKDPDHHDRSPGWLARVLIAELNRDLDLFNQFQTDRIMNFAMTAVLSPDYTRRNTTVRKRMVLFCTNIAIQQGAGAIKAEIFTGFIKTDEEGDIIRTIDYATFHLSDGSFPFANVTMDPTHKSARLLARKVTNIVSK